ncbi:MAG: hypothetical protein ACI9LE_000055 [Paraglaciecola sp.]|jgi:hypothetical protein
MNNERKYSRTNFVVPAHWHEEIDGKMFAKRKGLLEAINPLSWSKELQNCNLTGPFIYSRVWVRKKAA